MRSRWFNLIVLLALLIGLLPQPVLASSEADPVVAPVSQDDKPDILVEPGLQVQLMGGQTASYLIYFRETPDLSAAYGMEWIERGRFVANALSQAATRSQASVRAYLDERGVQYKTFWIDNIISVQSSNRTVFNGLLNFSEIEALRAQRKLGLIEPQRVTAPSAPQAIEPNIAHVGADQVWDLGFDGEGLVVANVDTGVRYSHEALVGHYRGNEGGGTFDHNYNWWDPYGDHPTEPGDDNGHGSHTMGTMVGDDGGANQIGMAPGAEWMACRACSTSSCSDVALLECAEFYAAPWDLNKANANPDYRPNVVNNSWGDCSTSYDPWYQGVVDAWHAAAIYPVFSNGNASNCGYSEPPGLNTVGNPARYGNVTGVGSSGRDNGEYASHSNWGPTDNPDTVNPTTGWEDLKPQVLAPGVNIRSSVNSGDTAYQGGWSGTSMSAPHVTGLIALMWQAAPCLVGDYATTETIIEDTATPIPYDDGTGGGEHFPNYASGWGEINTLAAVQVAASYCGDSAIVGHVTDAASGDALPDTSVVATSLTAMRQTATDNAGNYVLTVFSDTYTLRAARYGYQTAVIPNVVATTGATTTRNIALTPAATYEVSGRVTDATTGWPLYAHITISGDPVDPIPPDNSVWTDPVTGQYSVMLAEGVTYTLQAVAWTPGYSVGSATVSPLTQDATANFALAANLSACAAPGYYITGGMIVDFEDDSFPPPGWTVTKSGNCEWEGGSGDNPTGGDGDFAMADSDACGSSETMDSYLISPIFNASALSQVILSFAYDFQVYSSGELAAVDVSRNGGATWTNVVNWTTEHAGPATFTQDVSAALAGAAQAQIRFHYRANWGWWWALDHIVLGNPVCNAPASGGMIVGNIYDENYPTLPLSGATVVNSAGYETTAVETVDPAVGGAFYALYAPVGVQVFTVTLAGGYAPDVATLTIVNGATVEQDFSLPSGLLRATPAGVAVALELGYTASDAVTLSNVGGVLAGFVLSEREGQFTPVHIQAVPSSSVLHSKESLDSIGRAPQGIAPAGETAPTGGQLLAEAAQAYAVDLATGNLVTFMSDVPGSWTVIGGTGLSGPYAGDFLNGDFSQMYVLDYDANSLYVVDTATGDATLVGASSPTGFWTGLTGSNDGVLYASSTDGSQSYLYTINPATGASTLIGEITNSPIIISIAINAEGQMYGLEIGGDVLVAIDPETGAATTVGSVGFNASYAQGMDFEEQSGVLYLAAYDGNSSQGQLRIADMETGATALVGAFPGGAEVDCLSFATVGSSDVAWLAEDPVQESVAPSGAQSVTLDFDAAYVDQPGEYHASLVVKNDTPYGKFMIPVTMTVTPPNSWGNLTGTVTGLDACDADPAPLAEAEVLVESATTGQMWTLVTDANGVYTLWVDQAQSPLTVTVTTPDYSGETGGLVVRQRQTTTADFDLRLQLPCLSYDPADFDVTLAIGANTVEPLTLSNTGAAAAEYALMEAAGGFMPMASSIVSLQSRARREFLPGYDPLAMTTEGVLTPGGTQPVEIFAAGDVLAQWDSGLTLPWGAGYSLNEDAVWLSNPAAGGGDDNNHEFETDGTVTGRTVAAQFGGSWAGDIAYNRNTGMFWQVNVGGDNCIYEWDPDSGETGDSICGAAWTATSQRGLAYDPTDDTFFIGGWNDANVYHIDNTGAVIEQWPLGLSLSGLAYNFVDGYLFIIENSAADTVSVFDVASGSIVNSFTVTGFGSNAAAGLGIDCDGNLWAANMADTSAYLIDSGVPASLCAGGADALPWVSESPVTGTIAADTEAVVDLTFDAGVPETMQPGTYYGTLEVDSNAANDVTNIPMTLTVTPPATWGKVAGTVSGLGYCDLGTPVALEGVTVTVESATGLVWTLLTDVNGAYQLWLDVVHGPLTITIGGDAYVEQAFANVPVTAGGTTTQNATLRSAQPCLSANPNLFDVEVMLGEQVTLPISLINDGAAVAEFAFAEVNGGVSPAAPIRVNVPASTLNDVSAAKRGPESRRARAAQSFIFNNVRLSTATHDVLILTPDVGTGGGNVSLLVSTLAAFSDLNVTVWDPDSDGEPTVAELEAFDVVILGNDVLWNNMDKVVVGDAIADYIDGGGKVVEGLYVQSYDNWGFGGRYRTGGYSPFTLASTDSWDPDEMFVVEDAHPVMDDVVSVDDNWGHQNPGISAGATLLAEWDATGYRYIAVNDNVVALNQLLHYQADWSGDVGMVLHNAILWLNAGDAGGDIPWLFEVPQTGVVNADSTFVADLGFDAGATITQVTQPGEYFGVLYVNSDDPINDEIAVPVTMTVTAPPTWGKLKGTVESLGRCDNAPAPLVGVNVLIEGGSGMTWTVTTDVSGTYQLWLDESYSPVTITVEAPEHEKGEMFGVMVAAGNTTMANFGLRWLVPCLTPDPAALSVTLGMGDVTTVTLSVDNDGGADADWDLSEAYRGSGFTPLRVKAGRNVLVVDESSSDATAIEAALTALGDTYVEVDSTAFTALNVATIIAGYDAVIYVGIPSSGSEQTQCIAYLDAGGSLLITDNDFAYNYCDGTYPLCTTYLQAEYNDEDSGGVLTGADIMAGVNPDITADSHPDDFTLTGTDAVGIFVAPTTNWSGLRIARAGYKAILLAWDYSYTASTADETEILSRSMNWLASFTFQDVVPWLSENPTSGTTLADASSTLTVTFDASVPEVAQPGDYLAWINAAVPDDDEAGFALPVTMTILPPAGWGKVSGVVSTLGACDAETAPLEGAQVIISNTISGLAVVTLTTDISGTYVYWLPGGSYTILVSADEHVGDSAGVTVSSATPVVQDFALTALLPCVTVETVKYQMTLMMGLNGTLPLTMTNTGGGDADFELWDVFQGDDAAWLDETPSVGTVQANDETVVDIVMDAARVSDPGVYYAALHLDVGDLSYVYPATLTVTLPASYGRITGTVTGLGPCNDPLTAAPLEGAVVTVTSATETWTVETDEDGHYSLWLDEAHSPVTVTASASVYVAESVAGVQISAGATTAQNFLLDSLAPCISVVPDSIHEVVTLGMSTTVPMTISNISLGNLNWTLSESDEGFEMGSPVHITTLSAPERSKAPESFIHNGPINDKAVSRTPYIYHGRRADVSILVYADDDQHSPTAVETALQGLGLTYTFYGNDSSGANLDAFIAAYESGEWDLLILAEDSWGKTNASEFDVVLSHIESGGMAIVHSWIVGYGSTQQNHPLWAAMGASYAAWVTSPASLYWWAGTNSLFDDVPEFTDLDDLGYLGYGARMNLLGDPDSGLGGFSTTPAVGQAGVIVGADSKTIYKGLTDNLNGADLDSDSIMDAAEWWANAVNYMFNGGDVPWLSENPETGLAVPGDPSEVTVTLDSGVPEITQPGDYYATLKVQSDEMSVAVPVTMTVEPPASWGKLTGLVRGLGYCDATPAPMAGAVVFVESAVTELVTYTMDVEVYGEDFEVGDGGYTHSGTQDEWEWGTLVGWPNGCASGVMCWGTDLNDDYNSSADQTLLSPIIDLSAVAAGAALTASWQQAWSLESCCDSASAEVSINGGAWTTMWDGTGTNNNWAAETYDVSAAAGGTVQFRWRLTSDSSVEYPGYYIDFVRITTPVEASEWQPVSWVLTTDAAGEYGVWFDQMYSPVTVTISNEAGYDAQTFTGVAVTAGNVTTLNADLVWLQPCITVSPDALSYAVPMGTSTTVALNLANLGAAESDYLVEEFIEGFTPLSVMAVGGPDDFGYEYADSNGGATFYPTYAFVDIAALGAPLSLGDNDYEEVDIGFNFKFYGDSAVNPNLYGSLFVGSNGFLSFGAGSTDLSPDATLPDPTLPNNLIAAAWDDLAPGANGTVYVQSFDQCPYNPAGVTMDACFIVQYDNFVHADGAPAGTWEVILFRTGSVLMQYESIVAPDATTGLEAPYGLDGLNYAPALADELAICFAYPGEWLDCQSTQVPWLDLDVDEGTLPAYDDVTLNVTFDAGVAEVAAPGTYRASLQILTEDPLNPYQVVPVTMTVAMPSTLGKLSGVVYAWNQCDVMSTTLANALLSIESSDGQAWALHTDAAGAYSAWLPAGETVTVTVAAEGYAFVTMVETIAAGVMSPHNVELHAYLPCISMTPGAYDVTLPLDRVATRTLTIQNTGAAPFDYSNISGSSLWLSVDPKTGSVPAGDSTDLTLIFNSVGLASGDVYSTVLEVTHLNPAIGRLFVRPVRLTVTAAPTVTVEVVKTSIPSAYVLPGGSINYTVVFTNTYDQPLTLTATDAIPANTAYVPGTVSGGASYVEMPAQHVVWAGSLDAGEATAFSFSVQVGASVPTGTLIANMVSVEAEGLVFTATKTLMVSEEEEPPVVVEVTKTSVPGTYVLPGGLITYTVSFTNRYIQPLSLTATDVVPANTTYVAGSATGGAAYVATPVPSVVWTGSLNPNATATFSFAVQVGAGVPTDTQIINTVAVVGGGETFTATKTVTVSTQVEPGNIIYLPLVMRSYSATP